MVKGDKSKHEVIFFETRVDHFGARLSRTFKISPELRGHLNEDLDPWHELSQDVEGSGGDETVDDGQTRVVIERPDVKHDLVQAGSC